MERNARAVHGGPACMLVHHRTRPGRRNFTEASGGDVCGRAAPVRVRIPGERFVQVTAVRGGGAGATDQSIDTVDRFSMQRMTLAQQGHQPARPPANSILKVQAHAKYLSGQRRSRNPSVLRDWLLSHCHRDNPLCPRKLVRQYLTKRAPSGSAGQHSAALFAGARRPNAGHAAGCAVACSMTARSAFSGSQSCRGLPTTR